MGGLLRHLQREPIGRPDLGHSRPSRLARKATYDRSCLKADIRRAPTGLVLEVEIPERLPGGVADNEARLVVLDRPRRREAAHGSDDSAISALRRKRRSAILRRRVACMAPVPS